MPARRPLSALRVLSRRNSTLMRRRSAPASQGAECCRPDSASQFWRALARCQSCVRSGRPARSVELRTRARRGREFSFYCGSHSLALPDEVHLLSCRPLVSRSGIAPPRASLAIRERESKSSPGAAKNCYLALGPNNSPRRLIWISQQCQELSGALGGIRTPDPQIRSLVLYPAELRAHGVVLAKSAGDSKWPGRKPAAPKNSSMPTAIPTRIRAGTRHSPCYDP
jgi:hypothetical protein